LTRRQPTQSGGLPRRKISLLFDKKKRRAQNQKMKGNFSARLRATRRRRDYGSRAKISSL